MIRPASTTLSEPLAKRRRSDSHCVAEAALLAEQAMQTVVPGLAPGLHNTMMQADIQGHVHAAVGAPVVMGIPCGHAQVRQQPVHHACTLLPPPPLAGQISVTAVGPQAHA